MGHSDGAMSSISAIDRISPTRRPDGRVIGLQRWRDLLFAHWPVPIDALRAVVPAGLDIDTFEGTAFIGIVPLVMRAIRRAGMPAWMGLNFLETNLRTYVHVGGRDPAVYFFSLDASSRIAVEVARHEAGLPYYLARMTMARRDQLVRYAMTRGRGSGPMLATEYEIGARLGPSVPGTLQHFLLERYLLHVERRGRIRTMQIHHTPYPAQMVTVHHLRESLCAAAGLPSVLGLPPITHYAAGVDVEIFDARDPAV
jgi:uncharacterized protein YqjF (DUF2071 family)